MLDPLILTARFDSETEAWLEALRRAHFPPERNLIPAHVTLFHALPGEELDAVMAALAREAAATLAGAARIGPPRPLGRGVALEVASPELARLRSRLAREWAPWLTRQDAQGWRPHATVQNKVSSEAARALLARLQAELAPREAMATGLRLWHYRSGPWEAAAEFSFTP
jgi:2'-5' RNA ligase